MHLRQEAPLLCDPWPSVADRVRCSASRHRVGAWTPLKQGVQGIMDTSSGQEFDRDVARWRLRDHPSTSLRYAQDERGCFMECARPRACPGLRYVGERSSFRAARPMLVGLPCLLRERHGWRPFDFAALRSEPAPDCDPGANGVFDGLRCAQSLPRTLIRGRMGFWQAHAIML
jgi:hypothetical protein